MAAKVLVDALYDSLQQLADFAGLATPERLPCELCILLMVSTVEKHLVKVGIQAQIGRRALDDGARAGLCVMA